MKLSLVYHLNKKYNKHILCFRLNFQNINCQYWYSDRLIKSIILLASNHSGFIIKLKNNK